MIDVETRAPQNRFKLTREQLQLLLYKVNEAFLSRRRTISPGKNIDPQSSFPTITTRSYLYVPSVNKSHGSIYVNNIEISKIDIRTIIDMTMTAIVSALKSSEIIEALSKRDDAERVARGERPLRAFEGPLNSVRWADELVARELAQAYQAITGFKATMGAYKRPKFGNSQNRTTNRIISSPFTEFAMMLISISGIKRLGAGDFSVAIIRDALSGHWKSDEMDGDVRPSPTLLELAKALPKRKPGRRPHGMAMWELDRDLPMETHAFTDEELESLAGRNDRWMKFALFGFRRS